MIIIIIVSYSIFVSQNILNAPASALRVGGGNPPPQLQSNCDSGFATVLPFSFKHPPLLKSGSAPVFCFRQFDRDLKHCRPLGLFTDTSERLRCILRPYAELLGTAIFHIPKGNATYYLQLALSIWNFLIRVPYSHYAF